MSIRRTDNDYPLTKRDTDQRSTPDAAMIERVRSLATQIEYARKILSSNGLSYAIVGHLRAADLRALCDAWVAQDKALQIFQIEKAQLVMDLGDAKSVQP